MWARLFVRRTGAVASRRRSCLYEVGLRQNRRKRRARGSDRRSGHVRRRFPAQGCSGGRKQLRGRLCRRYTSARIDSERLRADAALASQGAAIRAAADAADAAAAQSAPAQVPQMRWMPGPPPAEPPGYVTPSGRPISLTAPSAAPTATRAVPQSALPLPDDSPDDIELPRDRASPTYSSRTYGAPVYQPPQRSYDTPANQSQQRSV